MRKRNRKKIAGTEVEIDLQGLSDVQEMFCEKCNHYILKGIFIFLKTNSVVFFFFIEQQYDSAGI